MRSSVSMVATLLRTIWWAREVAMIDSSLCVGDLAGLVCIGCLLRDEDFDRPSKSPSITDGGPCAGALDLALLRWCCE